MFMHLSNLLVPAMMFFALGLFAQLIRSDLKFPPDLTKRSPSTCWSALACIAARN